MLPHPRARPPTLTTRRLRAWAVPAAPSPVNRPRWLIVACRSDMDLPAVVATAVLWRCPMLGLVMDHMEVSPAHRRTGLATELWRGLERWAGERIAGIGTSVGGRALVRGLRREVRP